MGEPAKRRATYDDLLAVPEGLVGRVVTVAPHLSKVILIGDTDCAVGGRVVRTGDQGVVPPPKAGPQSTPVIPPPGTPGGNQQIRPK